VGYQAELRHSQPACPSSVAGHCGGRATEDGQATAEDGRSLTSFGAVHPAILSSRSLRGRLIIPAASRRVFWRRQIKKKIKEDLIVIEITAPMGGKVLDVKVKPGDTVNEDDEVLIIEAMKMELPIVATGSGTVKEVKCNKGDTVEADAVLVVLE